MWVRRQGRSKGVGIGAGARKVIGMRSSEETRQETKGSSKTNSIWQVNVHYIVSGVGSEPRPTSVDHKRCNVRMIQNSSTSFRTQANYIPFDFLWCREKNNISFIKPSLGIPWLLQVFWCTSLHNGCAISEHDSCNDATVVQRCSNTKIMVARVEFCSFFLWYFPSCKIIISSCSLMQSL